jgi:hypothetical protein
VSKSSGRINYGQRLRAIRPYVDFDYDLRQPLSSAAKAQITRYYGYIQKLTVRQHQVYRSKNADNLRAVQRFAQHDPERYQRLTVAFVPNSGKERMKLRIDTKGRVRGKTGSIGQVEIPLDPYDLLEAEENGTAAEYVDRMIDEAPPAKRYVVMAGEFEVPSARHRGAITAYVVDLMSRYSSDRHDENDKNSHHYKNWMFGLIGYNFHAQAQLDEYRTTKRKATKERARAHVTQNRREKRIRENPPGFWINDELGIVKRARPPQPAGWEQVNQRRYYEALYGKGYREVKDRAAR